MTKCRACSKDTHDIISFGEMPCANAFVEKHDFEQEFFFELATVFCPNCKMVQLVHQPAPEKMFHEKYSFFSGSSKKMTTHFESMAKHFQSEYISDKSDAFVVELGSNDGIMLQHFATEGIKHLGIEPSENVAHVARQNGVNTICEFFGEETAQKVLKEYGKADIIAAANVMNHIADMHSVGKGVDLLLKEKGIFVFEDPYLGDILHKVSYDQFYDEHIYTFSVSSVRNTFAAYGLEVFHVESQITHGGSMRYYLGRQGEHPVRDSVTKQLNWERATGLENPETFNKFKDNCESSKAELVSLLTQLKEEGKRVVGYAATAKSTTVLNYCDIGPDLIDYICDTTPLKQGKYSPGMHIPVKPYEDFKNDKPDYAILFAWNHAREILEKEKQFIAQGGKWIVFVPKVKVCSSEQETLSFINNAE